MSSLHQQRADRSLLAGTGCLFATFVVGALVTLGGFGLGLAAFFAAQQATLAEVRETPRYLGSLEWAVAWCGVGSLGLLIACGAVVILLKELGDETARRQRGDVRSEG